MEIDWIKVLHIDIANRVSLLTDKFLEGCQDCVVRFLALDHLSSQVRALVDPVITYVYWNDHNALSACLE